MRTEITNLLQKSYPYLIFNAFFPVTSCFHSCILRNQDIDYAVAAQRMATALMSIARN